MYPYLLQSVIGDLDPLEDAHMLSGSVISHLYGETQETDSVRESHLPPSYILHTDRRDQTCIYFLSPPLTTVIMQTPG